VFLLPEVRSTSVASLDLTASLCCERRAVELSMGFNAREVVTLTNARRAGIYYSSTVSGPGDGTATTSCLPEQTQVAIA
jgi:hypothetical protein